MSQQNIEQNVRLVIGDLHVNLIMAQARIQELEAQLAELQAKTSDEEERRARPNGATKPGATPPAT